MYSIQIPIISKYLYIYRWFVACLQNCYLDNIIRACWFVHINLREQVLDSLDCYFNVSVILRLSLCSKILWSLNFDCWYWHYYNTLFAFTCIEHPSQATDLLSTYFKLFYLCESDSTLLCRPINYCVFIISCRTKLQNYCFCILLYIIIRFWLIDCFTAHQHRKAISAKKRC